MTPANHPLSWIGNLRRKALAHPALAFGVRSVAGLPARTTVGRVPAAMNGTRSTREGCAPPAFTSGLRLSASRVLAGRPIRSGMRSDYNWCGIGSK
jgi:hypothetical protein